MLFRLNNPQLYPQKLWTKGTIIDMENDKKIHCFRCNGQKILFKVNSVYSQIDTGGAKVACPMCNGEGKIKSFESVLKDVNNVKKERRKRNVRIEQA